MKQSCKVYLLSLFLALQSLLAVSQVGTAGVARAGDVQVSLVTIYPGSNLYEIYGHTELRVTDSLSDTYYNYGLFDFNAPHFVYRFVAGHTDYMCGGLPGYVALREDMGSGRKVVEQVLNLTADQARQVRQLLALNCLPQNATYRYKFLSDNCATRPRDIIERVLGKSLHYHIATGEKQETYRDIMSHYNGNYPWEAFGIDLALGLSADTVISYRQKLFIPMHLMSAVASATVDRPGGGQEPLVTATRVLNPGSDQGTVLPPTPWWATPLALAVLLLAAVCYATWRDLRRGRLSRLCDSVLFLAYGLAGCIVYFLIFVSTHESTSPNLDGLWLHPFYLLPAVMVWVPSWRKPLLWLHGAMLVEMAVFMIVAPFLPQHFNIAFYPLMLVIVLRSFNYVMLNRNNASQ